MEQSTSQRKKQPLLTWKSFLISAGIILALYLVVNAITGGEKKKSEARHDKKISHFNPAQNYDYTIIDGDEEADDSILSIPIQGVILTEQSTDIGFFNFLGEGGVTYGYDVKDQLKRAAKDSSIKGVVLEINSPGGTIPGANAIAEGVAHYRKATSNPVYAHISDVGASGAYWSAVSTDFIVADPGSTIGSIGVIMGPFKQYKNITAEGSILGGVETEGGIENRYITAGQYKDTGSPYRTMSPDEEKHWQTALNSEYNQFVAFVSSRRNISPDTIINTIKAFPYETERALQLHLIDTIGSREATYAQIAEVKNLADYNIIQEETSFGFLGKLLKGAAELAPHKSAAVGGACYWCNGPLLLYDRSYTLP